MYTQVLIFSSSDATWKDQEVHLGHIASYAGIPYMHQNRRVDCSSL